MKWFILSFHFSILCFISLWKLCASAYFSYNIDFTHPEMTKFEMKDLIVPGTKWCGAGNRAENYWDLGVHSETDKCCREHDNCPFSIGPDEIKYSLYNYRAFTMSDCRCDDAFKECLTNLKKTREKHVSKLVKHLFFHTLKMQCFTMKYGVAKWRRERCFLLCRIRRIFGKPSKYSRMSIDSASNLPSQLPCSENITPNFGG